MRRKKDLPGAQNKPHTQTLEQAFLCSTPYNKDS